MKAFNTRYRFLIGSLAFVAGIPVAKSDFLQAGRDAFMNYNFELAAENYEKYAKSLKKTPNANGEQLLETYERQLETAENALENVQKIEIIDRIDVPAEDFFRYIKLPAAGGKLLEPDASILKQRSNQSDFAFSTESGDALMWSELDETGKEVIMQSERLLDNSWEEPQAASDVLNDGGNARNPFMLTDGLTLYYISDGEGSMGGYDLFVATKDPASGEFRQPISLGYPFNSPYNEYLLAIDEDNGIGWWVTDRNKLDGQLSVYVYKTNEVRKNYVMDDEEDIISLARVDDITLTQNPDADYKAILKGIDERSMVLKNNSHSDFIFPMPGGRVVRNFNDFLNKDSRRDMQNYLKATEENAQLDKKLLELRKKYHASSNGASSNLRSQILELEKKREEMSEQLKQMRNNIISLETKRE